MTTSEILVTRKEIIKPKIVETLTEYDETLEWHEKIDDFASLSYHFSDLLLDCDHPKTIKFSANSNLILMQFCLDGECSVSDINRKKTYTFANAVHNSIYIPKGDFYLHKKSATLNLLHVYIEEDFFFRQMPDQHDAFNKKKIGALSSIFSKNIHISPRIKSILVEIETCQFEAHLKILYLKAKIIELLTMQLADAELISTVELKMTEVEKMAEVKKLIETNLQESFNIAYLARVAGTNEQYLKKHFKLLYGNTVFGYILSCKMQKAKDMLLAEKHQIVEVAEAVGYKHATHFTTAFKRFFGYLPSAIKAKLMLGGYLSFGLELEFLELLVAI
ncbi:MAG: AraC family transcriptional regulator [Pedobacter sp.]|nr:MAG: AraC family transcriptional regulator [Pedobacter sp.]